MCKNCFCSLNANSPTARVARSGKGVGEAEQEELGLAEAMLTEARTMSKAAKVEKISEVARATESVRLSHATDYILPQWNSPSLQNKDLFQ